MSALYSARGSFEGARVLDAFAGSGALGLECLSRGAEFVLFCEQGREAVRIVEQNIAALKLPREAYRVRRGDSFTLPESSVGPFDMLFFDPPYAIPAQDVCDMISRLDEKGAVSPDALICYEFAKKDKQDVLHACVALEYQTVSVKDYGDTSLITLRKEA